MSLFPYAVTALKIVTAISYTVGLFAREELNIKLIAHTSTCFDILSIIFRWLRTCVTVVIGLFLIKMNPY
jgi:hypothetical protein